MSTTPYFEIDSNIAIPHDLGYDRLRNTAFQLRM